MSMFSRPNEKKIPQKLSDCTQTDNTADNLYTWAETLARLGSFLLVALIIVGVLSTITDAAAIAEVDEDLIFSTVLTSIAKWGIYAFIEFCVYRVLALLISALATITQNTVVSANVALYKAHKDEPSPLSPATIDNPNIRSTVTLSAAGMWTCKNCGTGNKDSHGQCKKCGLFRS